MSQMNSELPEGTSAQVPTFPRVHTHALNHLPNAEFKTLEIRENDFANFILVQDGRPVAEATHPDVIWAEYRKRVLAVNFEDEVRAHSMGITMQDGPVDVLVSDTPEVREARKDYHDRWFAKYEL